MSFIQKWVKHHDLNNLFNVLEKLMESMPNFRIPVVFIDEFHRDLQGNMKLLRNIVRCLVLPCVLSSTNATVSNMLNLKSGSSLSGENRIWVNGICRLFVVELKSIFERVEAVPKAQVLAESDGTIMEIPAKYLIEFVDEKFGLKVEILGALGISCNEDNKAKLLKIWNFLLSQSETCLQGASLYSFNELITLLKSYSQKDLDCNALWKEILLKVHQIFILRKSDAFKGNGKFYSLRMMSTNQKFTETEDDERNLMLSDEVGFGSSLVRNSIDQHFYHFGAEVDPNVMSFEFTDGYLKLGGRDYDIKSHFLTFEKDTMTSMILWYDLVKGKESIASIVRDFTGKLVGIFPNPNASSNDFRTQEVMSYWTLANASHQNFHGTTSGIDFFCDVVKNLQILSDNVSLRSLLFNDLSIPEGLNTFLKAIA